MQEFGLEETMAQVVYYLCRNGKVEPPHMIDVVYHSPGLRLRDVKQRLTALRGSRMPAMYSWSFKRNYKNASIWQDVFDDDFVLPVSSGEYVLKGSEIVENLQGQGQALSLKQPVEVLQRKFWGAESWLTSVDASKPRAPDYNSSAQLIVQRRSWEQAQAGMVSVKSGPSRRLGLSDGSSSDEKETRVRDGNNDPSLEAVRHSTGNILQDPSIQNFSNDVKMYTIKAPVTADHSTQTNDLRRTRLGEGAPIAEDKTTVEENKAAEQLGNDELPLSIAGKKQSRLRKVFSQEKEMGELGRQKSKNGSSPWMFLHVLSYCGGLDTKAQSGNTTGNIHLPSDYSQDEVQSGESRTDGEAQSFSDASRETHQSRTSTGDSFNSSEASDEGRAHKISAFVDVKEMLVSSKQSTGSASGGKSISLLGRQYGRLSKSGAYYPRNVKYDRTRGEYNNRAPLKVELNCYNAE